MTRMHGVCPHDCPSTCALEIEVEEGALTRVYGADNPYTAATLCAKVGRYGERINHPQRLLTPQRRTSPKGLSPSYVPISWEEALDRTAEALLQTAQKFGTQSVWPYFYAGTMGLVQRDGIQRLRHAKNYSGQTSTFCVTLADTGWQAGVGGLSGTSPLQIAQSDLILVWGANPVHTQVNLMHHIAKARRTRAAKLVVIDTYRTATAAKADYFFCVRPGTDGALAAAVIHVLLAEGFADLDYLARYSDWDRAAEAHFAQTTPEWASAICGVSVAEIYTLARLYGQHRRAYLRIGFGLSRSRNGAANVHAVSALPAVTGAWQHPGGGALYSNRSVYGIDKSLIEGTHWYDPATRKLDQSQIGAVLCDDEQALHGGERVMAMLMQNINPAAVAPDSTRVKQGLSREDLFVCVHEQFMTDTTDYADIVLPATMFPEHDDIYQGSGHHYLMAQAAILPAPGACRSNHQVISALMQRLGVDDPWSKVSARALADATLSLSGQPDFAALLAMRWHDLRQDPAAEDFQDGFAHADGRFHFYAQWGTPVLSALPGHDAVIEAADEQYPLRLVTAPARHFLNTSFTETPTSRRQMRRPKAQIHPQDLIEQGLADQEIVRISSRQGSIRIHVEVSEKVRQGTVVVESVWDNGAFLDGMGVNTLTSAQAGYPNGGAVFHDTAICLSGGEQSI